MEANELRIGNYVNIEGDVVRSERDYMYFFRKKIKSGQYVDKLSGFPLGGKCVINRGCKLKPIKDYCRKLKKNTI